jgi:hypothetical protein
MPFPAMYMHCDLELETRWGVRKSRLYYEPNVAPSAYNHIQAASNAMLTKWGTLLAPVLSDATRLARVTTRFVSGGVDLEAPSTIAGIAGTGDPDDYIPDPITGIIPGSMPDETCLIFQRVTGVNGRSKRGRIFIAGISETVNAAGRVTPLLRPDVIAIAEGGTAHVPVSYSGSEDPGDIAWEANLNLRHYDRKNNMLIPVVKMLALDIIGSRIDRRSPLGLNVLVP